MKQRIALASLLLALAVVSAAMCVGGPALASAVKDPSADPTGCAKCHPRPAKELGLTKHQTALDSVKRVAGAGDGCLQCHSTDYLLAPEGKKPTAKTAKSGVTCTACHFDHQAQEGIDDRRPPLCEDCHSGGKMQLGQEPHHPQNEMMLGTSPAVTGVPKMPSMFGKKDCNGCHMPVINGQRYHDFSVLMPDKKGYSCDSKGCHEGQGAKYTKLVQDWQAQTSKALAEVKALLDARKAKSGTEAYQVALFNYQFVETDRSKGVHNFPFAMKLLEVAKSKLSML